MCIVCAKIVLNIYFKKVVISKFKKLSTCSCVVLTFYLMRLYLWPVNIHVFICFCNYYYQVWKNDELFKSQQIHNGAMYALTLDKGSIFTGGWDRIIHIQVCVLTEF